MNIIKIEDVKKCTEDVIKWNELEKKVFKKKSKLEWLRLGDGNNSYFHASIKTKHNAKNMRHMHKNDGTLVTSQSDIKAEVLNYYEGLMGTNDNIVQRIHVMAMRERPQLSMEQREHSGLS